MGGAVAVTKARMYILPLFLHWTLYLNLCCGKGFLLRTETTACFMIAEFGRGGARRPSPVPRHHRPRPRPPRQLLAVLAPGRRRLPPDRLPRRLLRLSVPRAPH